MPRTPTLSLLAGAVALSTALFASPAGAATPPVGLGTATSFSVLAGAGITNTGATTIAGDVGTFATTSESGFGTVTLNGVDHAGDAVTQQAKTDLTTAYNDAAASGPPTNLADELGGLTLTPGVYRGATLQITGTLTLDTLGDPNAVFVFQTGSTLITASSSNVAVIGSTSACNVFWQVPSSATLGTTSNLVGTVMASTSISAGTGATIDGRLLASTGAVTLDHNTITRPVCATVTTTSTTTTTTVPASGASGGSASGGTPTTVPAPGSGTPTTTTVTTTSGPIPPLAFTGPTSRSLPLALTGAAAVATGAAALAFRRRRI